MKQQSSRSGLIDGDSPVESNIKANIIRHSNTTSTSTPATTTPVLIANGRRYRRPLKNATASSSDDGGQRNEQGSLLWTFLLLGLIFCLVDVAYLLSILDHQDTSSSAADFAQHDEDILSQFRKQLRQEVTDQQRNFPHGVEAEIIQRRRRQDGSIEVITSLSNGERERLRQEKAEILTILRNAGVAGQITDDILLALPTWKDITSVYGTKPHIVGLDQCEAFQSHSDPAEHFVATAGMFNSGTNLMAELLIHNCQIKPRMKKYGNKNHGVRWQVSWGKHIPADAGEEYRLNHKTAKDGDVDSTNMLPAVTIRDPFWWLKSMCVHPYRVRWMHIPEHCPNLVPNEYDKLQNVPSIPAKVSYPDFERHHLSLVHVWNDWYNGYYNETTFPRIMVRYEDLLFFAKEATEAVCHCAGGELIGRKGEFHYVVSTAKKGIGAHGDQLDRTNLLEAMIKYGRVTDRTAGIDPKDLEFARKHLDSNLMDLFGYPLPPTTTTKQEQKKNGATNKTR